MAQRNGHAPYRDVADAISHFPETATAIAVRWNGRHLDVLAPYGLHDMWSGIIRPTPQIRSEVFAERCVHKRWSERWPGVRIRTEA
jgi:hypothetical protein